MSAAPLPRPAPEPSESAGTTVTAIGAPPEESSADAEGWALLDALRRKLDDQGAAQRKTSSQVGQLADSIAGLVAEQRRRSRWANMNSFVAYLIFTVVVGAAFFALYRSRASELLAARDTARKERDASAKRADDTAAKLALRESTDTKAWEVYQLLDAGKRVEATTKLGAIEASLSKTERAVLAARAHETQVMEVEAALKAATNAFKAGHFGEVVNPLEAALVMESQGARAAEAHYLLGVAYAKANDLPKAISHLRAAVDGDTEHDDARFQLASALDRSGLNAKARAEYDQFATAHPQLGLAVYAMRRSATLARMPATSPMVNGTAPGSLPMAPPTINGAPVATPKSAPVAVPKPVVPAAPKAAAGSAAPMSSVSIDRVEIVALGLGLVERKHEPSKPTIDRPTADKPPTQMPPPPGADSPAPNLPIAQGDRTPPPSSDRPHDREPPPAPRAPQRGEQAPGAEPTLVVPLPASPVIVPLAL